MQNETHKNINPKQQMIDEIARIEGLSRTKKWKAAQQYVLKVNPDAKKDHIAIVQDVKKQKEQLGVNKYAAGKQGMRWGMRMPQSVLLTLELFDPELKQSVKKDANAQRKELHSLMKVFPEYCIPRSI